MHHCIGISVGEGKERNPENNLYIWLELHRMDCAIHHKKDLKSQWSFLHRSLQHSNPTKWKLQTESIAGHLLFQSDYGMVDCEWEEAGFTFSLPAEFCWCCTVFCLFPFLMRLNLKGKKRMADWATVVYLFVSTLFDFFFFFRFCMGCFRNEKSDVVCRHVDFILLGLSVPFH